MRAWIVCPMVEKTLPDGTIVRYPKIMDLVDPGIAPVTTVDRDGAQVTIPGRYRFSIVEQIGQDWCIANVTGRDFANLNSDPDIVKFLEGDNLDLSRTPNSLNWPAAKRQRIRNYLASKGANVNGLNGDSPLWHFVRALGRVLRPDFAGPAGTWCADPDEEPQ